MRDEKTIRAELKMIEQFFARTNKQGHLYTTERNRATRRRAKLLNKLNQIKMRNLP